MDEPDYYAFALERVGQERIQCSAIHYHDGEVHAHQPFNIKEGIVLCGLRHNNCIASATAMFGIKKKFKDVNGFLTNTNIFVDREEGFKIATAANQIIEKHGPKGSQELFSEDIY